MPAATPATAPAPVFDLDLTSPGAAVQARGAALCAREYGGTCPGWVNNLAEHAQNRDVPGDGRDLAAR
jgi:hypothetical protein